MISHSIITIAFMLTAPWLVGPVVAAAFITGFWWSREQYWAELKLRKVTRHPVIGDVVGTIFSVWRPTYKNMDLIAPTIIAWASVGVFVLAGV